MWPSNNPVMESVTLVVMARDEARCIERCLQSFAPFVDRLLVLDTGSLDDTVERARRCGAQVAHFDWVDDFAAARNAALDQAGPGWHLVADADEWLEAGGPHLRPWLLEHPHSLGTVTIRNQFEAKGQAGVCKAQLPRLLPQAVRYAGRIHEQPQSPWPLRDTALVFGHDGYCDAQRQRKQGRNERLLRQALQQQPDEGYLLFQLGCELSSREALAEAREVYAQALSCAPGQAHYRGELVRRHLVVLQSLKAWDAAAAFAETELAAQSDSAYFMLTLGNLFWNWCEAQPVHAAALLPSAHESWRRALHLAQSGPGPGVQMEQTAPHAALSLAALHRRLGDEAQAARYEALAAGDRQAA